MNGKTRSLAVAKIHSPGDSSGTNITSARRCLTRTLTLTGATKIKVPVPFGAYNVNITHKSATNFIYYEGKATNGAGAYAVYTEDGIEYGTGKTGADMMMPCYDDSHFWIRDVSTGTGDVEITFFSILEV